MSKPATLRVFFPAVWIVAVTVVAAIVITVVPGRSGWHPSHPTAVTAWKPRTVTPSEHARLSAAYAALPLAFEANQGQTDPQIKYMARGNGYTLFLTKTDAVFAFHPKSSGSGLATRGRAPELKGRALPSSGTPHEDVSDMVHMHLVSGNSEAQIAVAYELPGKTNYYIGNDPKSWHTNVSQYARVFYKNVYPGVDLAYYGERNKLEFDFIVAPESNPAAINLTFGGAQRAATDASGSLVVSSTAGNIVLHKPVAYQLQAGARQLVDANFAVEANHQVTFKLGNYDHARELVIDPTVTYATYLGGSAEDDGYGIAFDSSGYAYVTGQTESTNFPVVSGGYSGSNAGNFDVFVTKIAANGSSLIYSTYVGGSGNDSGNSLAVDSSGDAFVAGGTTSSNFPTTASAFQKDLKGSVNAFVFELNPSGTALTYSTYVGGTGTDVANGIAIDTTGAYLAGSTSSTDFPTLNAYQSSLAGSNNGFVTKLNPIGSGLLYSTYLGGGTGDFASAVSVPPGAAGPNTAAGPSEAYVTGATQNTGFPTTAGAFQMTCGSCSGGLPDAFVTVFDTAGTGLIYSTFLGGAGTDQGLGIAVDSSGAAYVTGMTQSADFPLQSAWQQTLGGTQNAFLSQLKPAGSALVYSTYFGGSQTDWGTSVALDQNSNAYLTGQTSSPNFPVVSATQATIGGGNDAFISELNSAGVPVFSTYLGGSLNENTSTSGESALGAIAVDSAGANVYVTGNTLSTNFPTVAAEQTTEAGGIDAFVVKYALGPSFNISATTPAAVAPGSSGTSTVTLTAVNGYNSPVNLGCSVSGTGVSCSASSFSPDPVTPTGAGVTSTLTITTTGSSSAIFHPSKFFYAMWLPIAGISLMGMGFSSVRSRRKKLLGFLMVGMVMAALFLMPACGGSSSTTTTPTGCTSCTPAGAYTVTITGTGTDANATTNSTTVTLTVN